MKMSTIILKIFFLIFLPTFTYSADTLPPIITIGHGEIFSTAVKQHKYTSTKLTSRKNKSKTCTAE